MKAFSEFFPPIFLLLNGALYLLIAWLFGSDPQTWFAAVDISLPGAVGMTELRATYVGLLAGTGLFLIIAGMVENLQLGATLYLLFAYAGFATLRGWGIFIQRAYNDLIMQLFIAELLSVAGTIVALYCIYLNGLRRRNPYF